MDPLLSKLQSSGLGLSINNFYAGGFLHADDIRTIATSAESIENQVVIVNTFARENFLQLNISKCEIISFSHSSKSCLHPHCEVDGVIIPVRSEVKCLGFWWRDDLFASKSVSENIGKARRSFFLYGNIGAFQGDLNPLSTRCIIEMCVLPVLLYGSENWILSDECCKHLESFIGEMAKRALKWPKHFSNTAALVALDHYSIKSILLLRKLTFLRKQLTSDSVSTNRLGVVALKSLSDDMESLCLVKECRELESIFNTDFTTEILIDADSTNLMDIKRTILKIDKAQSLEKCALKAPLIAQVVVAGGSWPKLWDNALHLGSRHLKGLKNLTRIMAHHGQGSKPCPLCDTSTQPLIDHVLAQHHRLIVPLVFHAFLSLHCQQKDC